MVAGIATRTRLLLRGDVLPLYVRMREERVHPYVVQGDGELSTFAKMADTEEMFLEITMQGEAVGFWWVRHVYADAYSFHFCLFKKHRKHARGLFGKVSKGLAVMGVKELFCFVHHKRRDLAGLCQGEGMRKVADITKEIGVWVADLKR